MVNKQNLSVDSPILDPEVSNDQIKTFSKLIERLVETYNNIEVIKSVSI